MCFLSTNSSLRTNESVVLRLDEDHDTRDSPFEKLGLKMIDQFPLDLMHLRDLGFMKKILKFAVSGNVKGAKLSSKQVSDMSELIENLKPCIPSEFARKPRGLDEVDRLKATECRLFFYYLAPLLFNVFWSHEYTMHFNSLHAALSILSDKTQYKANNTCAKKLIKWYLEKFKILYGEENLVFTFHCLLHLPEQALLHGILDSATAYPFENFMRVFFKNNSKTKRSFTTIISGICSKITILKRTKY